MSARTYAPRNTRPSTTRAATDKQRGLIARLAADDLAVALLPGLAAAQLEHVQAGGWVSAAAASDLIDALMTASPKPAVRVASPKQVALIARLAQEKNLSSLNDDQRAWLANTDAHAKADPKVASTVIDTLFALPAKADAPKAAEGYYTRDAEVFVVVANKAKTRTYAKRLEFVEASNGAMRPSWVYAPGLGMALATDKPLTVAEAGALGHLHGFCIICCRALTDPASVQAGIGPVCAKRLA